MSKENISTDQLSIFYHKLPHTVAKPIYITHRIESLLLQRWCGGYINHKEPRKRASGWKWAI